MWKGSISYVHKPRDSISNPDSLSSSETRVNTWIRSWRKHLSECARCQKAVGGVYFTKKQRAVTLQPCLEFDNLKPRLKRGIFNCISWLAERLVFLGWWSSFSERRRKNVPYVFTVLYSTIPFLSSHPYSLGWRHKYSMNRNKNNVQLEINQVTYCTGTYNLNNNKTGNDFDFFFSCWFLNVLIPLFDIFPVPFRGYYIDSSRRSITL